MSRMNGIDSVGHFPNGFWRRWLMPLVGPLPELVLFLAIPFVGLVDNLVVASFAQHQVLVPKPDPACLQCTCELYPFAFGLISVHRVFLLCEVAMPWRGEIHRYGLMFPLSRLGRAKIGSHEPRTTCPGRLHIDVSYNCQYQILVQLCSNLGYPVDKWDSSAVPTFRKITKS